MRKVIGILVMLSTCSSAVSQNLQQEINEQVWKVQLEAMKENNSAKFMTVMSDEVVQVSYDREVIRDKAGFEKQAAETYTRMKEARLTRNMEFRFLNRIANNMLAFEDGFYKFELINENLEKKVFYGYFQVALRKENNIWKVLVDYDSENYKGVTANEEMFNSAKGLESY
jgi:hypothetical protein